MKNILSFVFLLCFSICSYAQITLSHNVGDTPVYTGMPNCEYEENWARVFTLSEFGISTAEQFVIRSGQIAISSSYEGAKLGLSVLSIDADFPNSRPVHLGIGHSVKTPKIDGIPQIIQIYFYLPIVVPAGVERILVVANQSSDIYNPNYTDVVIAGTEQDKDVSWFLGCRKYYNYTTTDKLDEPVPNANFYINVTGEKYKTQNTGATTRLSYNACDQPTWINQYGRTGGDIMYSKTFDLEDFGISNNEEFIINNGQAAFSGIGAWDVNVQFNIYKIDSGFPSSFSDSDLIGSSQVKRMSYFDGRNSPRIFNWEFESPVIVPNNVERILVEVHHLRSRGYSASFIAGTEFYGNEVSWLRNGSTRPYESINLNYYINVTGNVNHVTNNFEMHISNICSEFLKEFSVENKANVASVVWDFGDPTSGADNTSTDFSPFHDFSADGTYTITATVTGKDSSVEVLTETIEVKEPPNVYGIDNIYACETNFNTGLSASFNTLNIHQQILGGQTDKNVIYIDGSGREYSQLPNPFENTIEDRETINVRVSHENTPCCYSETSFDLIVNPLPNLSSVEDIVVCDDSTDGFFDFDLGNLYAEILSDNGNMIIEFYHEDGELIANPETNLVRNKIVNEEELTIKAINSITNCENVIKMKLVVTSNPMVYPLEEIIGCDDNGDGISEYFDISEVEAKVLGNQTNMIVTYYDANNRILSFPSSSTYTNSVPYQETITVRVTNEMSTCFSDTKLVLKTSSIPQLNNVPNKYACNNGEGIGSFEMSSIQTEIIGNQVNLNVFYYDEYGVELVDFSNAIFTNTIEWRQTIYVRVENALNNLCFSETEFDLIVNELPYVELDKIYPLCNLEPFLNIEVTPKFNSYSWEFQDGTILSNNEEVNLVNSGIYSLTISDLKNGVQCENSFDFEMIRSVLPKITGVNTEELSENNTIQIEAAGDGDFEYTIDGVNYQSDNMFTNVEGGVYTVSVRDKHGCGEDFYDVTILDYPKYFSPNNDGINDFWQILGIESFKNAEIRLYDRYGKLLKQINPESLGWNGTFGGKEMPSADYWFTVNLKSKGEFIGHFTLKR